MKYGVWVEIDPPGDAPNNKRVAAVNNRDGTYSGRGYSYRDPEPGKPKKRKKVTKAAAHALLKAIGLTRDSNGDGDDQGNGGE